VRSNFRTASLNDEQAIAFHVMPTDENPRPYLGHCMVVTVRHVDHLGDLTEAEVESVARASRALAKGYRGKARNASMSR